MGSRIINIYYGKDGLPYKDKDRQVHFPIAGTGFLGASNTTKIKFYYDELDNLDETTWVAVSKLPNGKVGSRVLESHLDSELNEHYALLELDNYYTQYKGDVFISLQGYQGGVDFDYDEENSQYEIHGTPTIAATGSIKFTINYANQFVGSGETDNINFQRILAALGTKLGMRAYSEYVEELPSEGSPDVFYVVKDDPNDPNLSNIYVWNENTQHYIWVGDNTLDLGNYYTKNEGETFENNVNGSIASLQSEISSIASGSPSGTYPTVEALTAAYPNGNNKIYVVTGTGNWYYWDATNQQWTSGGTYLSNDDALAVKDLVDASTYSNVLPDANGAEENSIYLMNFSYGSSSIPANLPWATWNTTLTNAILITINAIYKKQIFIGDAIYSRLYTGSSWGAWTTIMPRIVISQNVGYEQSYLMSQKAITDALDSKISSNTFYTEIAKALRTTGMADASNYSTVLPDASAAGNNTTYLLVNSFGETNIPANLPWSKWKSTINYGVLFTFYSSYKVQVLMTDITYVKIGTQDWKRLGRPKFTVEKNGNFQYTSLTDAIMDNQYECDIEVWEGEYDLFQEFSNRYGSDFYDGTSPYEGLIIGNGQRVYCYSGVDIKFEYTGSATNIKDYFSPIMFKDIGGEWHGGHIIASGCRYAIHDEHSGYGRSKTVIDGIIVDLDNPQRNYCIGGGLSNHSDVEVKNCVFRQTGEYGSGNAMFYHNDINDSNAYSVVKIHDNYCENGAIYVQCLGPSTKKSDAIITNNHARRVYKLQTEGHQDNFNLYAWNNEVQEQ